MSRGRTLNNRETATSGFFQNPSKYPAAKMSGYSKTPRRYTDWETDERDYYTSEVGDFSIDLSTPKMPDRIDDLETHQSKIKRQLKLARKTAILQAEKELRDKNFVLQKAYNLQAEKNKQIPLISAEFTNAGGERVQLTRPLARPIEGQDEVWDHRLNRYVLPNYYETVNSMLDTVKNVAEDRDKLREYNDARHREKIQINPQLEKKLNTYVDKSDLMKDDIEYLDSLIFRDIDDSTASQKQIEAALKKGQKLADENEKYLDSLLFSDINDENAELKKMEMEKLGRKFDKKLKRMEKDARDWRDRRQAVKDAFYLLNKKEEEEEEEEEIKHNAKYNKGEKLMDRILKNDNNDDDDDDDDDAFINFSEGQFERKPGTPETSLEDNEGEKYYYNWATGQELPREILQTTIDNAVKTNTRSANKTEQNFIREIIKENSAYLYRPVVQYREGTKGNRCLICGNPDMSIDQSEKHIKTPSHILNTVKLLGDRKMKIPEEFDRENLRKWVYWDMEQVELKYHNNYLSNKKGKEKSESSGLGNRSKMDKRELELNEYKNNLRRLIQLNDNSQTAKNAQKVAEYLIKQKEDEIEELKKLKARRNAARNYRGKGITNIERNLAAIMAGNSSVKLKNETLEQADNSLEKGKITEDDHRKIYRIITQWRQANDLKRK